MGNVMLTALTAPGGLWVKIINWIQSSVGSFAWTIILFTLLIKGVLSILDFFIKWSTKKSTLVQQKCAPQLEKLQKKYKNDQQAFQMQQQALYKKEGFNIWSSCLVMLANLVVTLLVFLSIFTSLKEVSAYQAIKQYQTLDAAYTTAYTTYYDANHDHLFDEEATRLFTENGLTYDASKNYTAESATQTEIDLISTAEKNVKEMVKNSNEVKTAVKKAWNDCKESWLWITNIWVKDGHANALPTYKGLKDMANGAGGLFSSGVKNNYVNTVKDINEAHYNDVTQVVHTQENGWNGYYILAVLAAVVTYLSSLVAELGNKLKKEKAPKRPKQNQFIKSSEPETQTSPTAQMAGSMKWMKFLLPVMMVIFVITSSAAFGIYVVTQSIVSIGLCALINVIVNKLTAKKQLEVAEYLAKIESKKKK